MDSTATLEIKFTIDDGDLLATPLNPLNEYQHEEELCELTTDDIDYGKLIEGTTYTGELVITYTMSWTDCGYEYDSSVIVQKVKELPEGLE